MTVSLDWAPQCPAPKTIAGDWRVVWRNSDGTVKDTYDGYTLDDAEQLADWMYWRFIEEGVWRSSVADGSFSVEFMEPLRVFEVVDEHQPLELCSSYDSSQLVEGKLM